MKKNELVLWVVGIGFAAGACTTGVNLIDDFINDPSAMDVVIDANTPDQSRTGTSVTGSEMITDSRCPGFFPDAPNHILDIDASTGLEVRISGDDGVVAALVTGQTRFCATPDDPLNRFFTRGELEIFVGSDQADQTVNYELEFVR